MTPTVPVEVRFSEASVKTTLEASRVEKLMVPEEERPVAPEMAPELISMSAEARVKVPVLFPILVLSVPVVFIPTVPVKFKVSATKDNVSRAEPTEMVSARVLLVPILMAFPPAPVPKLIILAVEPVPKLTSPLVPESTETAPVEPEVKDKAVPAPEVMAPEPAKPKLVAEVEMVSNEATPVKAPPVETFKPVELRAKVPVALPILVLLVPVVLMLAVPPETVKPAEPVKRPAEVMVPEPEVEMLPEVVMASPAFKGDRVVETRCQY